MDADAVTLVVGEEELLAERAVREIRAHDPRAEVHDLTGGTLEPGRILELTSPSLFGERKIVVIRAAQDLVKDVVTELTAYAKDPADDVVLVVVHAGGARGKATVEQLTKTGAAVVTVARLSRPAERLDFVRNEFRRAGRKISEDAARTLMDAVGSDLRELAAACGQLAMDTGDAVITEAAVGRYHRGRAEVTGFTVADRAVEGRLGDALEQLRWALATGVSPVLITSALAGGLRSLAKVGAARHLRGASLAKHLGMPGWKIDRVHKQLRGWSPDSVGKAIQAVAEADAEVKGGGADAAYALERAIQRIVSARAAG